MTLINRRSVNAAGLGLGGLALGFGRAAAQPAPATRLVPGKPFLDLGARDLAEAGYLVEEYFTDGSATRFKAVGDLGLDGLWKLEPAGTAPYTLRVVVVRPKNPSRFSGTVLVEWLNVSGGTDLAADWNAAQWELILRGHAYVGVSAQKAGIDGGGIGNLGASAKKADPARYGELKHPGDDYAYDIFTQAGRAARAGKLLGPLRVRRLLAAGESQSANFMVPYINGVHPLAEVYDGFLVHSRIGPVPTFSGAAMANGMTGVRIRTDLKAPVMVAQSETDVAFTYQVRQPDTPKIVTWEIAGSAHADTYNLNGRRFDNGKSPINELAAALKPSNNVGGVVTALPVNSGLQHHYVVAAAFSHLARWAAGGAAPPRGAPMEVIPPTSPGSFPGNAAGFATDVHGDAKGGVRSPWVDVPVARLSGVGNSGPGFAFLFGVTETFDRAKLAQLYPGGRADYMAKFDRSLDQTIKAGFMRAEDRKQASALAAAMWPG